MLVDLKRRATAALLVGLVVASASSALSETVRASMSDSVRDCDRCPEMIVVPAGEFVMGDLESPKTQPVHRVSVGASLAVGKYPVTRGQYAAFVEQANYHSSALWRRTEFEQTDEHPVVGVSWADANAYAAWLRHVTGKPYRLPTEAEWEYSARAGTMTIFYWGDRPGQGHANCDGCGSPWGNKGTSPADSFAPNAFGLHDMSGNVWQWVADCWTDNYAQAPIDAGVAVDGGEMCEARALRGGSWYDYAVRTAHRLKASAGVRAANIGFRVVRAY